MSKMIEPAERLSRLGIASIVIAIALPILFICPIIIAAVIDTPSSSWSKIFFTVGFVFGAIAPLMHLVGVIFGIIGLTSKKTKKLFPIIGTAVNSLLLVIGLLMIGFILSNLKFGFH